MVALFLVKLHPFFISISKHCLTLQIVTADQAHMLIPSGCLPLTEMMATTQEGLLQLTSLSISQEQALSYSPLGDSLQYEQSSYYYPQHLADRNKNVQDLLNST